MARMKQLLNHVEQGGYFVTVHDLEYLHSLALTCLSENSSVLGALQQLYQNKRRVHLTSTLKTAFVQSGKEAHLSRISAYQHEIDFLDEDVDIEPLN